MKLEAFIFDIGNVLVRINFDRFVSSLTALGADFSNRAALEDLADRYERGAVGRAEFLAGLRRVLRHHASDAEVARAWQEIFEPNRPMWELVEKLHGAHPLYLLSNTNCLHHEHLLREYGIFEKFSDGVYSYRVGLAKPDRAIFDLAIRQFGVRPEAAIYLDDLAANVEAARHAGLHAIRYDFGVHNGLLETLRGAGVQCV